MSSARVELEQSAPNPDVVIPSLQKAAEVATTVAETADAAGRTIDGIGKIGGAIATAVAIAARLLGGF